MSCVYIFDRASGCHPCVCIIKLYRSCRSPRTTTDETPQHNHVTNRGTHTSRCREDVPTIVEIARAHHTHTVTSTATSIINHIRHTNIRPLAHQRTGHTIHTRHTFTTSCVCAAHSTSALCSTRAQGGSAHTRYHSTRPLRSPACRAHRLLTPSLRAPQGLSLRSALLRSSAQAITA